MQLLKAKSSKKEQKKIVADNPFESISSIGAGMFDSFKDDLVKKGAFEARDEITGKESHDSGSKHGGELSAGQELDLSGAKEHVAEITEMGREFVSEIVHAGQRASQETSQETAVKIQEILIEIKQLAKSSKQLESQVKVVAIEQSSQKTGEYHINFLELVLSNIRDARMEVEDSLAWFQSLGKKKQARQYGSMAKSHGTSFTLSNERSVATQVG